VSALLSIGILCASYFWVRQTRQRAAALSGAEVASRLRTGLATPVELLHAVQQLMSVSRVEPLSLAQFRQFCAPALARHPEIAGLEWFPLVAGDERGDFERWVAREQPGFEVREPTRAGPMVRAVPRAEHVPLTFMEPFVREVQGLDLAFDPERLAPVHRALAGGRATLSDRFQLVEDPPHVSSVAVYAPVYAAAWADPAHSGGNLYARGVAVALFRLSPLLAVLLDAGSLDNQGIELWDPAAPEPSRLIHRAGHFEPGAIRIEADVPFVDRTYRLVVFESTGVGWVPFLAFALTLIAAGSVVALLEMRRKARWLTRAAERLGQYQLDERIARGGMGSVYKAHHALLRRPTAIKIANAELSPASFEKEVRLTSALTHPNTVMVYDFGRGKDGAFYCAMEYIDGYDFEMLVRAHGPLPPARAIRLLLQAAASLEEAHDKGLVHRDVKPANIMLTERGGTLDFVKVLDFGLARARAGVGVGPILAQSALFAGTPGYAAPEVIAGSPATPASDVFSLGAVGYFLVAGRGPFSESGSSADALTRTLATQPAELPHDVPEAMARLLMACLAKLPEERPPSMGSLSERLRAALLDCAPWTRDDAVRWWAEHPPRASDGAPSSQATFAPASRGLPSYPSGPSR
jgi:predicted Ser/Thr protein kinase